MLINQILELIDSRIHELKYEEVHLKTFIDSDQERKRNIEFAISQLKQLQQQILNLTECKKAE
ncbi:MAG: hypothetical protein GX994_09180 [Firmicutes bacterium]|nr:hypothetical protein [Bacillota bacterium]